MTIAIEIDADFILHSAFPARENCEKCSFNYRRLCQEPIEGIWDRCYYGLQGFWSTNSIEGKVKR